MRPSRAAARCAASSVEGARIRSSKSREVHGTTTGIKNTVRSDKVDDRFHRRPRLKIRNAAIVSQIQPWNNVR